MAKTIVGAEYTRVTEFLKKHVEPQMQRIVEEVNRFLRKRNVRIGAEIQWFIESVEDENKKEP